MADESKLPKWVQEQLRILRMRLREANERIDELNNSTTPEKAQVVIDPFYNKPLYLPEGTTVRFILDRSYSHGYIDVRVRSSDKGRIYINGGNRMVIRPEVSNAVTIEVE